MAAKAAEEVDKAEAAKKSGASNAQGYTVTLCPSGFVFPVPECVAVLAAARSAGIDMPASCRNGTCRTCLCKLLGGRVRYSVEWPGLSADERMDGYTLPCVALAESDLVLEVPGTRPLVLR